MNDEEFHNLKLDYEIAHTKDRQMRDRINALRRELTPLSQEVHRLAKKLNEAIYRRSLHNNRP